jgi:hypothetical protein
MTWVRFFDLHSGGGAKTRWGSIYVEGRDVAEAVARFQEHTGRDPEHVTCTCCGDDYAVSDDETLERACAYDRGCRWAAPGKGGPGGRWLEPGESVPDDLAVRHHYRSTTGETMAEFRERTDVLILPMETSQ